MNTDMERQLRAHVAHGSGLATDAVIPGNDAGHEPQLPYASVLLVDEQDLCLPMTIWHEGRMAYDVPRRAVLSVSWYGQQSQDMADRFALWCYGPVAQQYEYAGGYRVKRPLDVTQLDEVVQGNWERRRQVDMTVEYTGRLDYSVPTADRFSLDIQSAYIDADCACAVRSADFDLQVTE